MRKYGKVVLINEYNNQLRNKLISTVVRMVVVIHFLLISNNHCIIPALHNYPTNYHCYLLSGNSPPSTLLLVGEGLYSRLRVRLHRDHAPLSQSLRLTEF